MVLKYYVYIIRCSDNSLYIGVTNNLERRLNEHNSGENKRTYIYPRRPVELVCHQEFLSPNSAIVWEKKIKKWSKKKKEALIRGNFELLVDLSKKKFN